MKIISKILYIYDSQSDLENLIDNDEIDIDELIASIRLENPHYNEEEIKESLTKNGYKYNYNDNINNLAEKSIVTLFYDKISVKERKGILILETSDALKINDYTTNLEKVIIKIKTNRELIETNAKEIEGNTYIWKFESGDLEESTDHTIYLKLGEKKKIITISTFLYITIGIFLILAIVLLLKIKSKNKF